MMIIAFTSVAQSFRCKAYEFAVGYKNEYGKVIWNDWKVSDVPISINLKENRIRIYSSTIQDYQVLELSDKRYESDSESYYYPMKCMDKEGLICGVRLRFQYSSNIIQLYVEYKDFSWVYNIEMY